MIRISRRLLAILCIACITSAPVLARGPLSLDEAVEQARGRVDGRVISAETRKRDGQRIHNIRMLTKDGKVKRIRIDGNSGRQLQRPPRQR